MGGKKELSVYLLGEGARVEGTRRPILLRAELCGADEEFEKILVRCGARKDFADEKGAQGV